jgi:Zn-dependent protease
MKTIQLGKLFGLQIGVFPLAIAGTFIVWGGVTLTLFYGIKLPLGESIFFGLIAALLHWTSELIHSLGHAYAAKRTGYPMIGITFGALALFALTRYPKDEPDLPPALHIRRALGGPIINGLLSIILYLLLPLWRGDWLWIGLFTLLENIFVYTLQVFLPLGFNDGSTILNNLRRKTH